MQFNGRLSNNSVASRARWFQTPIGLQARKLRPGVRFWKSHMFLSTLPA